MSYGHIRLPGYRFKPLPQMIHQTLSCQVIHGNGNRIERMPVKPPPCVLYTEIHEPNDPQTGAIKDQLAGHRISP